jgi:hypothetical protein
MSTIKMPEMLVQFNKSLSPDIQQSLHKFTAQVGMFIAEAIKRGTIYECTGQ